MVATAGQRRKEVGKAKRVNAIYERNVRSAAKMLDVSLVGVETALHLQRDAWSTVK